MLNRKALVAAIGLLAMFCAVIAGCTKNTIYRAEIMKTPQGADPDCDDRVAGERDLYAGGKEKYWDFKVKPNCSRRSIEQTKEYTLFFIELDEQGRFYDDSQMDALTKFLNEKEEQNKNPATRVDLSIVTFVHGWRHNAESEDLNVKLARETLSYTFNGEIPKPHPNPSAKPREVVGIYVGWRGLSTKGPTFWELISVWDRKNTAQNVAVGSIRELFSLLKAYQESANATDNNIPCQDPKFYNVGGREPFHCKRVRLLIVGHSFGGLMVYNAVAGSLIDSVTRGLLVEPADEHCKDEFDAKPGKPSAIVSSYADLIVLVNPAVEGARFEALHQAVARRARIDPGKAGAFCPNQRPVLIAFTSEFDYATRYAFWAARVLNTVFESTHPVAETLSPEQQGYLAKEEYTTSINAMGHIPRFHTHILQGNELRLNNWATSPEEKRDDNELAYLRKLETYCKPTTSGDRADQLLQMCRCDTKQWWGEVEKFTYKYPNPDRASCQAYVEELNAAEMVAGAGGSFSDMPWMPHPSRNEVQKLSDWEYARKDGWVRSYCGGATIQHIADYGKSKSFVRTNLYTKHSPSSPVWNVYSRDRSIINDHGDLDQRSFKTLMQQLYHAIVIRESSMASFEKLGEQARDNILKHCLPPS